MCLPAGSPEILGEALNSDELIEPVRGPLIPGFAQVKAAALEAGERHEPAELHDSLL